MPWFVTLKVTDCSGGALLPGAFITDGTGTVFTDGNGEKIVGIADEWTDYGLNIGRTTGGVNGTGYLTKNVLLNRANDAGKVKDVCLNAAPPEPPTCFTGDTQVTMADGTEKAIADICEGDLVLGRFGQPNRVIGIELPPLGNRRLFAFNGGAPFVTAEHPFLTEAGWKAIDPDATAAENPELIVGRLTVKDVLLKLEGCAVLAGSSGNEEALEPVLESIPLLRLEAHRADARMTLYNLLLDNDHAYFANGWLVHNKNGCFIVSAATGSPQSKEVSRLRQLRERVTAASRLSGQLIDAIYREYYQFSPGIADEIKQDAFGRQAVLLAVVRPLLAWYSLAGMLAFEHSNQKAISRGLQEISKACPAYLGAPSIVAVLEAIRSGDELPAEAPQLLLNFLPNIRKAAQLRFASWAILDPLARVWNSAANNLDVVEEVSQWLATAPLESLPRPGTAGELNAELSALADMFGFNLRARQQLGKRLIAAWPDAADALEGHGFA